MSYSKNNGKYQNEIEIWRKKIPETGRAQTSLSEIIRCADNLYHEIVNNGGGNITKLILVNWASVTYIKPEWQYVFKNLISVAEGETDQIVNQILSGEKVTLKQLDELFDEIIVSIRNMEDEILSDDFEHTEFEPYLEENVGMLLTRFGK